VGIRVYIFSLDMAEEPRRIPLAKWERVINEQEYLPEFSGQSIKIAYAYIEVVNREPVYCHRIEGEICHFDEQGKLIDPGLPSIDLLSDLYNHHQKVVDLSARINKRRYDEANRWSVSQRVLQKIVDTIWK